MSLPNMIRCATALDKVCPARRIEKVGHVMVSQQDLFGNDMAPRWEEMGACKRCGREYWKPITYWRPLDGMLQPPGEAAKRYGVSRSDELEMLKVENQRLRDRLVRERVS